MPDQYGENEILRTFFNGQRGGMVVDVGAADGVTHSNSLMLIEEYGWSGLLVEPLPSHLEVLRRIHRDNPKVTIVESAVGYQCGTVQLHPHGQISTIKPAWKANAERAHVAKYGRPIDVACSPLADILAAHSVVRIDFLTVDCEGADWDVLDTLDWQRWTPRLICTEGRNPPVDRCAWMAQRGYTHYTSTRGNALWVQSNGNAL